MLAKDVPHKFLTLILLVLTCLPACFSDASLVLAQVGDTPITWGKFKPYYRPSEKNYDPHILQSEKGLEIKKNILSQYIDQQLLLNLAENLKVTVNNKDLEKHIKALIGTATAKDFQKLLKDHHQSYNDWKESQRNKMILSKLIKSELRSKIEITEKMMRDHYQNNPDDYNIPSQVRARHIMVKTLKKAEALLELLKKGGNFEEIAKQHSESPDAAKGGDLGFFSKGQFPSVFDKACFSLKPGEISEIVTSSYGFHLFKVMEKRNPQRLDYNDVKAEIRQKLLIEFEKDNIDQWLVQLRQEHPVTLNIENLKKIE
ncbi:MAG: hypothetical protein A3I75_04140 [Deltaproteobacteria bacterium RIFCSPLOWO2_02_FULL_50_16]|nr:MAG: hypothetical protein A3B79_01110 [Deltaproteobacteria bacterium RIFCSPHIGHO2_02_FULL_50_15]OGQ58241.1 MAG: hypothetical protein A3I75_04140 [Deltaproteobacteria bacterium RIFCSPLOWO2_02_FULL_50_16]OGQ66742.1 MAG: hypothetical protein A3F89_01135 [Deltaproteobacteria bacterium RIFCSPLOWO2_12_FULL_50_11]